EALNDTERRDLAAVEQRARELSQGRELAFAAFGASDARAEDTDKRLVPELLRDGLAGLKGPEHRDDADLPRRRARVLAKAPEHPAPLRERVRGEQKEERGGHGMRAVLKRGDDAQLRAAAPQRPEEVGVLTRVGLEQAPLGRHDARRGQVVAAQATQARL